MRPLALDLLDLLIQLATLSSVFGMQSTNLGVQIELVVGMDVTAIGVGCHIAHEGHHGVIVFLR